ncbi:trafficking protein particle complex subunit 13 [Entomortierella parvispora]|uniref:Trafficking protein particle complex subunit 13 n=1 Tax=Entomortierella parvispora TaxID=205924 RepID=A0A9P3HGL7_9FUNG|nr:trafficking protein particle complex subunit 13 [Entomortierella parvispora]
MAASGQDQHRESHLISLKVMRLSRPSLVTGQGIYFGTKSSTNTVSASSSPPHPPSLTSSQGEKPNMNSILTEALSDLSLSQLERVHPPSLSPVPVAEGYKNDNEASRSSEVRWEEALDMGNYNVSELLTMPASFGNIYLGETFTSYICANNESAHPVRDVILKAELQTSTSATRFALTDILSQHRPLRSADPNSALSSSAPVSNGGHIQLLESGKTNEMIVAHEIKELGTHILSCSIQYTTLDGQQKSFRKFYKFQVLNPLSVKTKVHHPASSAPASTSVTPNAAGNGAGGSTTAGVSKSGVVLLEALIQNMSGVAMWMERMRFEVADAFTVQDLNVAIEEAESSCQKQGETEVVTSPRQRKQTANIFGEHDYFAPNDVRQYLYVLAPRPGKELLAKSTNVLGKLDILWRTQFGETGRLHTSQLTRKPTPLEEIAVQVVKVPKTIRLEEVFSIEIVVKNQTLGSGPGSSLPANQQQPQQQQHSHNIGNDQSLTRPVSNNSQTPFGGAFHPPPLTLAKPPAAVARGAAVPPSRPGESQLPQQQLKQHQQQQQLQQSQSQLHPPSQTSPAQDQHAMKLMLTGVKQKMGAILLSGPNSRQLGSVPAGGESILYLDTP